MLDRLRKLLTKNPIIIGVMCILALMGGIVCYWYYSRSQEIVPTVITQELSREQNLDKLTSPEDAVEYFVKTLINKDIDQAMRVFPIDELCLNQNFKDILEEQNTFSLEFPIAPSLEYRDYFPIASAELTGLYAHMYNEAIDTIGEIENIALKEIEFISPDMQLDSKFQADMLKNCETYGADAFCHMKAILSSKDKTVNIPLTIVNYDGYWKIFRVGSELQEQITYDSSDNVNDAMSVKLEKQLKKIVNRESDQIDEEENAYSQEEQKSLESGNALLPPNYFVTNAVYGESPEHLMKIFVRYIQKQDLTSVLTLGNVGESPRNLENTTAELLENQAAFAKELKCFYYSILLEEDIDQSSSLEKIGVTGVELLEALEPRFFFYLEMREMVPLAENKYCIYFKYEGEYYSFIFEFSEYDNGWQIKSISNAERLTEKQYNSEIQDLQG